MIYIIAGASRSGKTLIAKQISQTKGIPYLSLDWLVMGFTNGIPEYGLHDLLMPDDIAKRLWHFLKAMCENMIWSEEDCIIEGEAVLPELIISLVKKHQSKLKVCFLGYTDIDVEEKVFLVKKHGGGKSDWLIDKEDAYIKNHIQNMIRFSQHIKTSCKANNLSYFDTSKEFESALKLVAQYIEE